MKKSFFLLATIIMFLFCSSLFAQVSVTATLGTPGPTSYTTLKLAFDAINAGTHKGDITVSITANTTEGTTPATLNSSGSGTSLYSSVLVRPAADGVSISGNPGGSFGIIQLNGADNVTIDGDNPNTSGTNRNLSVINTSTSSTAATVVIRILAHTSFITSANSNTIKNCIITGAATSRNSSGLTSTANSENTSMGIYCGYGNATAPASQTSAPLGTTSISNNGTPGGATINNLLIDNNAINACARGIIFNGATSSVSNSVTISNNLIGDQSSLSGNPPYTSPATTVYTKGIYIAGVTSLSITANSIKNIISYVATPLCAIELNSAIGSGTISISNNTITGVVGNSNNTSAPKALLVSNAGGTYTISGNTISNVQWMGGTTTAAQVLAAIDVNTSATSATIELNKITQVYNRNTGTYGALGITLNGGNNITVKNNFITDVNQDMSGGAGFSVQYGSTGLRINSGTGHKIYYNSIHITNSHLGTANSSILSCALGIASTSQTGMDIRNNIFSNTRSTGSAPSGNVSIFLPSGGTTSMGLTLNNNAYYSGTSTTNQGIAQVGTASLALYYASNFNAGAITPATNLRAYTSTLSVAGTNDNASFATTDAAPFVSSTDLHIPDGTSTLLNAGATPIAGITTDIDGVTRDAATPDIGADEFTGSDLIAPVISYTALSSTGSLSNRSFSSVSITDASGVQTSSPAQPKCYYKRSTDANAFNDNSSGTDGWKYVDCNGSSSPFDFTIDYNRLNGGTGVSVGMTIQYFVTAEDMAGTPNVGINSGTFAASQTSCLLDASAFPIGGTINSYEIVGAPLNGSYTVGLTLFRQLSGRNIEERLVTRKVKKLVPSENINRPKIDKNAIEQSSGNIEEEGLGYMKMNRHAVSGRMIEIEVEEVYTEYFENGKKYTGDSYVQNPNHTEAMSGDYLTLSDAINDLNNRGVDGPVTFLLVDGSYTIGSTITINNNISGISSSNSVIIKPQSGVSPVLTGTIPSNALLIIKSSYVTIDGSNAGSSSRDMQIVNNSTTSPLCVLIGSTGTTNLTDATVKNCIITSGGSLVINAFGIAVCDASTIGNPGYFSNITLLNNKIEKCDVGIFTNATTGSSLSITGNTLNSTGTNSVGYCGIYSQGFDGVTISGNEVASIDGSVDEDDLGMWLASGTKNTVVEKNKIHDIAYTGVGGYGPHGIEVTSGTASCNITIKNNIIYDLTGDGFNYNNATFGADNPIGINIGLSSSVTQSGINIYNNTIRLSGSTLNSANALSQGIRIGAGATVINVKNNLVVNNLGLLSGTGDGASGLYLRTNSSQLNTCDNNCYFINPSSGSKNFGRISTTSQTTLSGWRTASGKETVSFSSNPVFVSSTDFHITATDLSVSGRGTYIAGVIDDFDGDARATSQSSSLRPVDVGADQYSPAGFTTGNTTVPSGNFYMDGDLRAVEKVGITGSITGVVQYPGVRTPNNLLRPLDRNGKSPEKINSKPIEKNTKPNLKKKDGTSGGNRNGEAVNTPWIYWEITGMDNTTAGALRFYYNEDQLAGITESTLKLSYWDASANTWDNSFTQSVNTTNNYIQVTLPTNNWPGTSLFALEDPSSPLPVVLESFNISVSNRNAGLTWVTTHEINNKGFSIERKVKTSEGYSAWKEIGFVNGSGTTDKQTTYNYSDKKLNKGLYQYRLRQVDFNGNFEYFNPANTSDIVIGNPNLFDISQNYPNPSNPKSKIDFQMPFDGKVSIKVYDLLGREVATLIDGIKTADFYTVEFDGTNLASGTYFYRIIAESGTEKYTKTLKMILVK